MLSITLRQLEYVVAAADHGGVSHAASAINVSQPSLSVAIAAVEAELGKSLFIRRKGEALVPTAFGRGFIDQSRVLLSDARRLVDPDAQEPARHSPITIGFFEDLAPVLLAPILRHLGAAFPDATFVSKVAGVGALADGLMDGRLDFAITYDLGLDGSIRKHVIGRVALCALIGGEHRFDGRKSISIGELEAELLILVDQEHSVRHMVNVFRHNDLVPRIAHRAASLETMRSLVGNGFGIGLSYTVPAAPLSYDGKPVSSVRIEGSGIAAEPIVNATNPLNEPTALLRRVIEAVASRTWSPGSYQADYDHRRSS